jgi:hypothetical protein
MAKDRKTLTDADIVSRRTGAGRGGHGESSDADTPRTTGDRDTGAGAAPPKARAVKSRDKASDRDGS